MMHWERAYRVVDMAENQLDPLCRMLHDLDFNLCTGFRYGPLLLLNDSVSVGSAPEYAVIKNGRQIESMCVRALDVDTLATRIDLLARLESTVDLGPVVLREHAEGRCPMCEVRW